MNRLRPMVAFALALCLMAPANLFAASHREAPITALDRTADITDWYSFVSYDHPGRVTRAGRSRAATPRGSTGTAPSR